MIELGPGADLFRVVGSIFWLIVIAAVLAAVLIPKTKKGKAIAVAGLLGVLLIFPGRQIIESIQRENAAQTRRAEAEKRFQEHCKKAGEFIYKTAENVEGILLMKVRPKEDSFGEQFMMDDPYGADSTGDEYIKSFFLEPMLQANKDASEEMLEMIRRKYKGYRYIEVLAPQDGKRYRYTGAVREVTSISSPLIGGDGKPFKTAAFVLDKTPATGPQPRYGVTYDDISTREDRDYWIAGSSLKVIDLEANEVIAERVGYMMDPGQGSVGHGGSHPAWQRAADHACPSFRPSGGGPPGFSYQAGQTRKFVTKVINPSWEHQ